MPPRPCLPRGESRSACMSFMPERQILPGFCSLLKITGRASPPGRWIRSSTPVTPLATAARLIRALRVQAAPATGRPPTADWGYPSPALLSRGPEAAFMLPTAPRPEPASRSSCPSALSDLRQVDETAAGGQNTAAGRQNTAAGEQKPATDGQKKAVGERRQENRNRRQMGRKRRWVNGGMRTETGGRCTESRRFDVIKPGGRWTESR